MKTIAVVAIVVVVGIFIGIIATADYGDFVKERELRNLELSYYEQIGRGGLIQLEHRTRW